MQYDKASALIADIQKEIDKHGDVPVVVYRHDADKDIDDIIVEFNDDSTPVIMLSVDDD